MDEEIKERRAGGEYFFVHTAEEFLDIIDRILYGN